MGLEVVVPEARPLGEALSALAQTGAPCEIMMVDGQLVMPSMSLPDAWRELRLRSADGMVTLRRTADGAIAVLVFGNASPDLLAMRDRIAESLRAP